MCALFTRMEQSDISDDEGPLFRSSKQLFTMLKLSPNRKTLFKLFIRQLVQLLNDGQMRE